MSRKESMLLLMRAQNLSSLLRDSTLDDIAAIAFILVTSLIYFSHGKIWDVPNPLLYKMYEKPQKTPNITTDQESETRNIAEKLGQTKKDIVVFWGSQSGTAEGFAVRLVRACKQKFGLEALAADLSDYDPNTIALLPENKFAIFIMSTYGEGDPSDNAQDFWTWVSKDLESISLAGLRYAALGLGNKNYARYNRVIDVVVNALDRAGASAILPVGKADDSNGATEEDFMHWKDSLFAMFTTSLGFESRPLTYEPVIEITTAEHLSNFILHSSAAIPRAGPKQKGCSPIKPLLIKRSTELFSSKLRGCIHVDVDLSKCPDLKYKTGDHIAIWPQNPESEIDLLVGALGLNENIDDPVAVKNLDPSIKLNVPTPTTRRFLLQSYFEICGPLKRETVNLLAEFAPSLDAKATLLNLGSDRGTFDHYMSLKYTTLGRFLVSTSPGKTWQIPFSFLVEIFPPMAPRYYSISSSSIVQPRIASLIASVSPTLSSTEMAENPAHIPGLATNYMMSQVRDTSSLSKTLYCHFRRTTFKLPMTASLPLVLIGAGTGLAPLLAFIYERARLKSLGHASGLILLIFGCRNEAEYIHASELRKLSDELEGGLRIVNAFSRPTGLEEKNHVQDRVREEMEALQKCLCEDGGYLYMCGSASMARCVTETLKSEFEEKRGWDKHTWEKWTGGLKKTKRWQEDVWG